MIGNKNLARPHQKNDRSTVKAAYYDQYSRFLIGGDLWWQLLLLQPQRRKSGTDSHVHNLIYLCNTGTFAELFWL